MTTFREEFEQRTKDAALVQLQLLQHILEHNVTAEYLQKHGLNNHADLVDGFKRLPIIEYRDIQSDIERIADGDTSKILCADPVCGFFISSGTTSGKSKMIPVTEKSLELISRLRTQSQGIQQGDLCLSLLFAGKQVHTKGGLNAETMSTNYIRSESFKQAVGQLTSPYEVFLAPDVTQSMYCHLLCGLIRSKKVTRIYALFAYILTEAIRMLEEVWQELVEDIRTGSLSSRITNESLRVAVSQLVQPDAELSNSISRECSGTSWDGILERLWPNAKSLSTVLTGAMAAYIPIIRRYAGRLPITTGPYASSESFVGLNLDPACRPEDIVFTIDPGFSYFEFLPQGDSAENELEPVELANVKAGATYELVVTTVSGLYRYRLGDIVKVTGFYNSSPQVAFLHRKNTVLSVATDKTDEHELQLVVQKALQLLPSDEELADFTSHVDMSQRPGHYVIFWELKSGKSVDPNSLQKCSNLLDASFNEPYRLGRGCKFIGPLELCIVQGGTFKALLQHSVNVGASASQYKTPRCITNEELLSILHSGVIQQSFSG